MSTLLIEFYKEKRTGVIPVLLAAGVLGMLYAFVNFIVRKETLLNMPIPPMDILLTQVYGMIMILNMFAIVVATCIGYNMEFSGNAVKKMYMLPISIAKIYFSKFLILAIALIIAIILQYLALYRTFISGHFRHSKLKQLFYTRMYECMACYVYSKCSALCILFITF